ncbi:MAG TPA: FMN-binding negative transcriptional regulator [Ktedonobacteraceae bacterium]|jgi:transcriptional regulator|nr:FMN-binding negative transcriptional regulator [Ktedonobacteraceae bacterium]
MYIPKAFREDDLEKLHKLMQEYSFAALVTQQDGVPVATHLPFLLDMERGQYGTLMAHMARANPQWRTFNSGQEALVIFQGPHAYISPSWYEVELSVPTWNYAAVHAYGVPRIIDDKATLYDLLKALIERHEAQFEKPWDFQLPEDYLQKMMQGTVGFEIEITRLEGKFKMSQNRSASEQQRVIAALRESQDVSNVQVAELMSEIFG